MSERDRPLDGAIYLDVPAELAETQVMKRLTWLLGRLSGRSVLLRSYDADMERTPPTVSTLDALRATWETWWRH